MSSSTNSAAQKYEVFLSFRGEDTRYGFVSHLFKALVGKGIRTYIDEKSLERGNEIAYSLQQAIQESKACVVVFSENYASSRWCLDELVHILKCKERHGQIVVPIFYHVEPTHVRKQKGRFGEAFSTLAGNVEKVNEWRTALSTASDLSGWHLNGTSPEADDVEEIVEDVKRKLNGMPHPNEEFKGLVGIKKRIDEIESLLCLSTRDTVCAIGIWGMGGIGKTTLADAAFKKFSSCFEGCCFLRNVREEWANTRERKSLKKKLHSEILREENPYNAEDRLREKKVLIVLDDIDDEDQLKLLVGDCNGIGSGSRVIVTTRNEQMVRYFEADDVEAKLYPVHGLNDTEALQLFNLKAFKGQSSKANQYYINEISKEVVNYAKGIPLALEVLGSSLRCKKKEEWKSYLSQLEEEPNDKIQKVLKVSYDGLNKKDQSIFLDIACFFKGKERGSVEETLNACYVSTNFCAKTRISNLIERALITVIGDGFEILWMHDLVEEMGHEIASSNNIEPGKRSRLWNAQAIFDVLKNNSGTKAIEGIKLNWTSNIEVVEFGPSAFEGMNNLRFLEIDRFMGYKAVFPGGVQYLPNTLRYLHWDQCGLKFFPSNFTAQNLVRLNITDSGIKRLWNGVQNLVNLRHIILNCCHNLTRIPDLSRAPKLESIYISSCLKLVEFPSSIKDLSKLIKLRVRHCMSLKALPQLPLSLQLLDATGCKSLETVATSQSAVVQAHREDYHVTHYEEFQFANCPRLDRNSRQSLMTESHIRVLRAAILSVSKAEEISNNNSKFHTRKETSYERSSAYKILRRDELFKDDKPGFQMCIPGNEIPKWFRYQSEDSSITIKLPPNWHANFIGFALCAVVTYQTHEIENLRDNTVTCTYSFKTRNIDEDHRTYNDHWDNEMIKGSRREYPSVHLFIWYSHEDYRDCHGATEISFWFRKTYSFDLEFTRRSGVHMLYRQEVEELGINENGMTYEQNNDKKRKRKKEMVMN